MKIYSVILSFAFLLVSIDSQAVERLTKTVGSVNHLRCSDYEAIAESFRSKGFDFRVLKCEETIRKKSFGRKDDVTIATMEAPDFSKCSSDHVKIVVAPPSLNVADTIAKFGLKFLALRRHGSDRIPDWLYAAPVDCLEN